MISILPLVTLPVLGKQLGVLVVWDGCSSIWSSSKSEARDICVIDKVSIDSLIVAFIQWKTENRLIQWNFSLILLMVHFHSLNTCWMVYMISVGLGGAIRSVIWCYQHILLFDNIITSSFPCNQNCASSFSNITICSAVLKYKSIQWIRSRELQRCTIGSPSHDHGSHYRRCNSWNNNNFGTQCLGKTLQQWRRSDQIRRKNDASACTIWLLGWVPVHAFWL